LRNKSNHRCTRVETPGEGVEHIFGKGFWEETDKGSPISGLIAFFVPTSFLKICKEDPSPSAHPLCDSDPHRKLVSKNSVINAAKNSLTNIRVFLDKKDKKCSNSHILQNKK
jgi:hypothetical protein